MARTRCPFTQELMTRLLKASVTAKVPLRIEIDRDKMVVLPATEPQADEPEGLKRAGEIVL